jgi:hypothetical protein
MTDRRTTAQRDIDSVLHAFDAEVARLMSLSQEVFGALDPGALAPLVVTIRAIPSQVPPRRTQHWFRPSKTSPTNRLPLLDLARTVLPVATSRAQA